LKRFEKEARSASALNHPNIVTIHDIGGENGVSYIAMELVEGSTLRELLAGGPLPIRKLLQIAPQIAEGLARAHEAGIVHRDLKPENVMVKKDGLVKILDFGLAKLSSTGSGSDEGSQLPTMTGTQPGVVVGTVSYMSPEQASGQTVDYRSDQFSLGSMLYEMATGKRAFQKKTAIDTLAAILNEEPPPLATASPQTPAPLRWIVERCLAKEPRQRYASTEDLARDLSGARDHVSEVSTGTAAALPIRTKLRNRALGALGMAALLAAGYFLASLRSRPSPVPRFQRVTFQQGAIWRARFAPDGQTIVYSMASIGRDQKPAELFATRVGSLDSRPLGLPPADILSISSSGNMAISLPDNSWSYLPGTLAEASFSGGAPRSILEHVMGADWSPDGQGLAVSHLEGGKHRLEYPIGKVLLESIQPIFSPRISADGAMVAFVEGGKLRLADRKGVIRTLAEDMGGSSYACWSPRGDELWWIKVADMEGEVHAVSLKGRERVVTSLPGKFGLHDLDRAGRMLVEHMLEGAAMFGSFPGEPVERSLGWLDQSVPMALSPDRQLLLFSDRGGAYLRRIDGSAAVRLGEGFPWALSPDGNWALVGRGPRLVLLPTGAGQERAVPPGGVDVADWAAFHPDGRRIYFGGSQSGRFERAYEQSLDGGKPTPVTPEGAFPVLLSPDGTLLLCRDRSDQFTIFPVDAKAGIEPRKLAMLSRGDTPVHWSADGRSLLIVDNSARPIRVDRLEILSGRRTLWRTLSPAALLGSGGITTVVFSADEEAWVVGYSRYFSELLVVDGLVPGGGP
jgi:hypothetical protein